MFLCLIYPIIGIALVWLTFGYEMLPLVFPLAFGFALIGPVAAVGLYEMSRRREQGIPTTWVDAFGAIRSPGFGANTGPRIGAADDLPTLAVRGQLDLSNHSRSSAAGLDRRVHSRRVRHEQRDGG